LKLFQNPFRRLKSDQIRGTKTADLQAGLDALTDFAIGKGAFGDRILAELDADQELFSDLEGRQPDFDEKMVLNLWAFIVCVSGLRDVSELEKRSFLDQYHELIRRLFVFPPEKADETAGLAAHWSRISTLAQIRYEEYFEAYREMWHQLETLQKDQSRNLVPAAPLMRLIAKNLFAIESDSLALAVVIQTLLTNQVIAFAKTFGSAEGWANLRRFQESALTTIKSGSLNS